MKFIETVSLASVLFAAIAKGDNTTFRQCGEGATPSDLYYFCGPDYEAKTAQEKLDLLWEQCLVDDTVPQVPYEHLAHLFSGNENKSFTIESDELPKDRPKVNHATGVVAKVRWVPVASSV